MATKIQELKEKLEGLKNLSIKAGLPKGTPSYPDGKSTVMIGAIHEYGAPSKGIPQRSFLRSTLIERRREWLEELQASVMQYLAGAMTARQVGDRVGERMVADIMRKIVDGIPPPNKPATIKRKAARGGHPTTLIDSGHLLKSISSEVEV